MQSRFVRVNGSLLKTKRIECRVSQAELARRAGFSDRLIRKAEAGGSLAFETVHCLAKALQLFGATVTEKQLIVDELMISKEVVKAYDNLGANMLPKIADFLCPKFVWYFPGDPNLIPFAGEWHGTDGLQAWLDIFFAIFDRETGTLEPEYLCGNGRVCAKYDERLIYQGTQLPPFWVNLHFTIDGGQLKRIDNLYDTQSAFEKLFASNSGKTQRNPSERYSSHFESIPFRRSPRSLTIKNRRDN